MELNIAIRLFHELKGSLQNVCYKAINMIMKLQMLFNVNNIVSCHNNKRIEIKIN